MTIGISRGELITASSAPDFAVGDDLTVADAANVGGILTVAGAVVAQSTLAVTGASTLTGAVAVAGALTANGGLVLNAGDDITVDGAGAGSKFGQAGSKIGFFGVTPVVKPTVLATQLTTITHTAPGTPDYALQNLVQNTGFGFATADEGNSVLAVIANLQARLAEAETKLAALGLLGV